MRPILFEIGSFPIHSYGLMFAAAFLIATYVAARRAEKEGIPPQIIFSLGLLLMVSAVVGARIFHILQHSPSYGSLTDIAGILAGGLNGLAFYGGFILALVVGILYMRWNGLSVSGVMDVMAPSLMLGTGIGRMGCFLAGCCFGKPTSLPWGITFPESSMVTLELGRMEKVHPTQLYSFVSLLVIFSILLLLQKHIKLKGILSLLAILMYSVHRFLVDLLRYYTQDERMGGLATSQVMSIIAAIASIAIMFFITIRQTSGFSATEAGPAEGLS